ncbi:MAG: hypothetical protein KBF58_12290 [Methyloversatilis sp.]|nr:hypothetical protein [Methyloversatilis sp.]MBP9118844.1 hypothetical protein [Methyloversatilis sp.]
MRTEAALACLDSKQRSDTAAKALEIGRMDLPGLVRSPPREVGAGASVAKLWTAGNIDHNGIPELRGVNLNRYRGTGREESRITVAKT